MAKIIEIQEQSILIKDGLTTKPILKSYFTFEPVVGDEVKVYQSGDNVAVLKVDASSKNNLDIASRVKQWFPQSSATVKKTPYCVLAILLGRFGVHKFYAGKMSEGILYVVLSIIGISPILSFVDFVIALTKKANEEKQITI
jgi:TM2 domain-containing membrane protein YozV